MNNFITLYELYLMFNFTVYVRNTSQNLSNFLIVALLQLIEYKYLNNYFSQKSSSQLFNALSDSYVHYSIWIGRFLKYKSCIAKSQKSQIQTEVWVFDP